MARVKFIRDKEPNILALPASKTVIDGALYVATDTGSMWLGSSNASLLQIKDNIDTNNVFVVEITLNSTSGQYNTDKNFSEIKEALLNGKKVIGILREGEDCQTFDVSLGASTIIYFIRFMYPSRVPIYLCMIDTYPNLLQYMPMQDEILYETLGNNTDGPVTQKVTNSLITYSETEPTDSNCRIWVEI